MSTSITRIDSEIKTITDWAVPQINGKLLITEGPRYGFVPDEVVSNLAGYLKTQHGNSDAVYGEARRGYEIDLGNGLVIGVTRKRGNLRRGNWLAFCRVKPQPVMMTEAETEQRQAAWEAAHEPDDYGLRI